MILTLDLPADLAADLETAAARVGLSLPEYALRVLATARVEISADYARALRARAQRADRAKFLNVLRNVPDVEPEEHDRL
jgi:hypothetical protein